MLAVGAKHFLLALYNLVSTTQASPFQNEHFSPYSYSVGHSFMLFSTEETEVVVSYAVFNFK
jgi:hypothetical protein